ATARADLVARRAKESVSNLHQVLDAAEGTVQQLDAAAADIQAALGLLTNGGPPLDPGKHDATPPTGRRAMAITTYAELQAAVGNWLDHSLFAARVPEFIALFEAAANRRLRVREQEATATLTPSSGAVALPADYLAWRRLTWTGTPRAELQYVHPSYLQAAYPSSPTDVPRIFTIEG